MVRGRSRWVMIGMIVLLAVGLRELAARRLPVDFDEPVYGEAGLVYAAAIRAGDLTLLTDDPTPEHPGLVKLLYAAIFLRYPPLPADIPQRGTVTDFAVVEAWANDPANQRWIMQRYAMSVDARQASALFGALHVLLLALVSPAAGALLAVHTYTVKYTAQIYLEALPMFMASVAVWGYWKALGAGEGEKGGKGERERIAPSPFLPFPPSPPLFWWFLSAVALGLAAAGKYIYAVAGLAIAADILWRWLSERRERGKGGKGEGEKGRSPLLPFPLSPLLPLLLWGGLALLVFYAANPYLWGDPFGRLAESVLFHAAYSRGEHVAQSGYPWWQPFVWLFTAQPATWHPGIIVTPLDTVTAVLGVFGLRPMWTSGDGRGRVVVLWWGIGLLFLLLWSTKWPQYSLIMTAPMCLCAAEALRWVKSHLPEELWARVE